MRLPQVGVHIADVSHFIRPGNALDKEAANRGTTVYLCGKVKTHTHTHLFPIMFQIAA